MHACILCLYRRDQKKNLNENKNLSEWKECALKTKDKKII